MFSINQINEKKFEKAALGYKPESVGSFRVLQRCC